jgi:hypothetical protein
MATKSIMEDPFAAAAAGAPAVREMEYAVGGATADARFLTEAMMMFLVCQIFFLRLSYGKSDFGDAGWEQETTAEV